MIESRGRKYIKVGPSSRYGGDEAEEVKPITVVFKKDGASPVVKGHEDYINLGEGQRGQKRYFQG